MPCGDQVKCWFLSEVLAHIIQYQRSKQILSASYTVLFHDLQKFVKAVQKSTAKGILQEDQIQLLTTINNEAKARRSTKSLVLGKAKVMSYEDLEEARAMRAEKVSTQEIMDICIKVLLIWSDKQIIHKLSHHKHAGYRRTETNKKIPIYQ